MRGEPIFRPVARLLVGTTLMMYAVISLARPDIQSSWSNKYPSSTSDDMGCQLCHQSAGGGSPWNAYGWELRSVYNTNGFNIDAAFDTVRNLDLDDDPISATVLDDIRANLQPGWTNGPNNTIYPSLGSPTTGQSPPSPPMTTALDFPSGVADPIADISVGTVSVDLVEVATGFNAPLRAVKAPGIDGSLFVVEQTGKIFRVELSTGDKTLFHDVGNDLVNINAGYDERGLLGLAFHPSYQSNGLFYTYQSEPVRASQDGVVDFLAGDPPATPQHRSMVVEYRASNASCNSSVSKVKNLMVVDQPQSNHNGGDLVFGPDGFLYISLGDGGGANDQGPGHNFNGAGRDNTSALGSILRVGVSGNNSLNGNYGIPPDNPFISNGDTGLDEIFAFGFRNPFRMSFDANTGDLYVGDVGQNQVEEIDVVINGGNYGWNWKEGSFFFYYPSVGNFVSNGSAPGAPPSLEDPIGEYDHGDGISITGGYVYRGSEVMSATGRYIFGDFSGPNFGSGSGRLMELNLATNVISELNTSSSLAGYLTGFGQDANNELYAVVNNEFNPSGVDGKLIRIANLGQAPTFPLGENESPQCPPQEEMCFPILASNGRVANICL